MNQNKYLTIGIVVCLAILAVLSTDFYVPAMPDMVGALQTSHTLIKLSVTIYMLGLALSPLAFGPLSDRFGRRPILLLCAALGLVGTLFCWAAPVVQVLIGGRLLQGIGLGGALSLGRTVGSDLFDKQTFAKVAGVISLCCSVGPAIAPVIGGFLHAQMGWRSIFMMVVILISMSTFAIIRKVPETIEKKDTEALQINKMLNNYGELISNKLFMTQTILAGLTISMLILFGVLSTFILQNVYHLSVMQYSWVMMVVTSASVLSRTANIILLRTKSPEQCINVGIYFMLFGAGLAVIMSLLQMHFALSIIMPAMLVIFGAGIIPSNTIAIAMAPFRHKGGSAGAMYGFITMLCVFAVSFIGSITPSTNLALGLIFLGISLVSMLMVKISDQYSPENIQVAVE